MEISDQLPYQNCPDSWHENKLFHENRSRNQGNELHSVARPPPTLKHPASSTVATVDGISHEMLSTGDRGTEGGRCSANNTVVPPCPLPHSVVLQQTMMTMFIHIQIVSHLALSSQQYVYC